MRRYKLLCHRSSCHTLVFVSILFYLVATARADATIFDVGEVFVAGGTLVIGGAADGTRINTGSPDGPFNGLIIANGFPSVTIPNSGVASAPVTGALLMSGPGATLGIGGPGGLDGRIIVGYNGSGTLLLSGGTTISATGPGAGLLGFGGPAVVADTPVLPSNGTAVVTGHRTQWTTGTLRVGHVGTGMLTISDGGVVNTTGNLPAGFTAASSILGTFSGASGAVTVTGARSTLSVVGRLAVGDGNPTRGNFGPATGFLNIVNGGLVQSAGATIGNFGPARDAVPAIGVTNIDGRGSRWDSFGPPAGFTRLPFDVGRSGSGTVNITNGGRLLHDGTPAEVPGAMLNLGFQLGSTAMVTVSGPESRLEVQGPSDAAQTELIDGVLLSRAVVANVGYNGRGQLNISDGAHVRIHGTDVVTSAPAGFLNIGRNPGSVGDVVVSGTLRVATAIGIATAADLPLATAPPGGVGTLAVASDGKVRTQGIRIGPGGTLTGDGSIIGNVVNAGGVIAPRGLTIAGDFSQRAGVLLLDIKAGGKESSRARRVSEPGRRVASASRDPLLTVKGGITIADTGAIRVRLVAPLAIGTVLDLVESGPGDVLRVMVSGSRFMTLGTGVFERLLAAHPTLVQVAVVPTAPTRLLFAGTIMGITAGAARCC
jgi:T5SS/PEP-CTERM-associated repeat protein